MARSASSTPGRRSTLFLLIYALAYAGGVIAYLPLLTLLLPIKVGVVAGAGRLGVLTATIVAGAVAASLANIVFGALSDRSAARGVGRRWWLAGGMAATVLAFAGVASAGTPLMLVVAIVAFQIAVNALLAPLLAIMAEEIPDSQKGVAGGLLAVGQPVAAALSATLFGTIVLGESARLAVVGLAVVGCTLPLLLTRARLASPTDRTADAPADSGADAPADCGADAPANSGARFGADPAPPARDMQRRDLAIAWTARLLVQVAGNALFAYLFYYFDSIVPGQAPGVIAARLGTVMLVGYVLPLPIALLIGRLADHTGQTRLFLFAAACVAATGLAGLAFAADFGSAAIAFCIFNAGASVFLALHAGFAMQLLPSARHRGRDLGLLNLTNTLPGLLGPVLTWWLATPTDFSAVMLVLAALALCGGGVILAARKRPQRQ